MIMHIRLQRQTGRQVTRDLICCAKALPAKLDEKIDRAEKQG